MRINNPRSLAGYIRSTEASGDDAYKLITLKQLEQAIKDIDKKFMTLLVGDTEYGFGGVSNKKGYAWLNQDGKINPSLIPALAITNTFTVMDSIINSDVVNKMLIDERKTVNVLNLLTYWLRYDNDVEQYKNMQVGDIIIVTPTDSDRPDPKICGTYIVSKTESAQSNDSNTNDWFTFTKLAYQDGNIVSINDKIPGQVGALTLGLYDILKEGPFAQGIDLTSSQVQALTNDVYRLSSVLSSESETDYRFIFSGKEYTRKEDFDAVTALETANRISSDNYLSGKIDNINDTIGITNTQGSRAKTASIYPQLIQLRDDLDKNAKVLDQAMLETNLYLNNINSQITTLSSNLNDKAIELVEYDLEWDDTSKVSITEEPLDGQNQLTTVGGDTLTVLNESYTTWTYKFIVDTANYYNQKIIAVFDEFGNKVDVDLTYGTDSSNDLYWKISVKLDKILDDSNANINVLTGKTWTILTASNFKFNFEKPLADGVITVQGSLATAKSDN